MEMNGLQEVISERWVMNRALFYNFWYYPNQELTFKDGCAVLRGHNGSGKSVTTQALITVLLDGDTSNGRLDPFGKRDRTLTDTVLGEKGLLGIDKRTGYMALEFRKGNTKVTKTIGMGVEADRSKKKPTTWYFILNGKQVGDAEHQINLYKKTRVDGKSVQVPLSEKEITVEIEQRHHCGKVYKDRKTYASMVNKGLFGFDSLTSYEGLMRLLIQARNPKLSDNSKPEAAASVLNDSLPQLTDEELRPLTSSIEAIDRLEKDLASYKKDYKSIQGLSEVYKNYLQLVSVEKGAAYLKAKKTYENSNKDANNKMAKLTADIEKKQAALGKQRKIEDDLENAKRERAELGVDEIEVLQERKELEKQNLEKFTKRMENAKTKEREASTLYSEYHKKHQEFESRQIDKAKDLNGYLLELKNHAGETDYQHHQRFAQHFRDNLEHPDYSFTAWEKSYKQYKEYVLKTKSALEKWDQLKQQTLELENSIGLVRMKADATQRTIAKLEDEYEEEVQSLQEQQMRWAESTSQLDVPRDIMDELSFTMEDVFSTLSLEAYLADLTQHALGLKEEIQERMLVNRVQIQQAEKEIRQHEESVKDWEEMVEIEPAFIQMKGEEWGQLAESDIAFSPFYEAFDFKEHVTSEEKVRIQSALYEAGILASVVVASEDVSVASEFTTVLKYQSPQSDSLQDVLVASENDAFNKLLRGIGFSKNANGYVLTTGKIDTNFITGNSSIFDDNLYIGKSAREEYRTAKISELQGMIAQQNDRIGEWNEQNEREAFKILLIEKELKQLPSVLPLQDLLVSIGSEKRKIEDIYEVDIQEKTKTAASIQEQMDKIKRSIGSAEETSNLPLELHVFEAEMDLMNNYGDCLVDIQNTYKDMSLAEEQAASYLTTANMQKEYEKEHREDAIEAEYEKEKAEAVIADYVKLLEKMGSSDILERVERLTHQINNEFRELRDETIRELQFLDQEIAKGNRAIDEAKNKTIPFEKMMMEAWENAFQEQLLSNPMSIEGLEGSLEQKAQKLKEQFKEKMNNIRSHVGQVKKQLTKKFQDEHVELATYELEMDTRKSDEYLLYEETEVPEEKNTTDEIKENNKLIANRRDQVQLASELMSLVEITMTMEDMRMSPVAVAEQLSKKINALQLDANEKDLKLYEEILINTLGENIRMKIHYVERWEKEMNKFMEHKDNIKFRLKWVPKKTDKDGELNTDKLVEALKKDSRWIKTTDIARHFRSKIKAAKRGMDKNKEVNLKEVMREVLDYRQWFEFEIYYTKVNDTEKRLNQGNYNNLSGGQRALAMITPVLAAIYAKYMDAREDAPRLFTLDEAFARMDDENTEVIFQYVQKMGFNYILNSQALWGCYESVPSLNIYELARPNNRPFVSINSYYWNGHKRTSVGNEEVEIVADELEPALV